MIDFWLIGLWIIAIALLLIAFCLAVLLWQLWPWWRKFNE